MYIEYPESGGTHFVIARIGLSDSYWPPMVCVCVCLSVCFVLVSACVNVHTVPKSVF